MEEETEGTNLEDKISDYEQGCDSQQGASHSTTVAWAPILSQVPSQALRMKVRISEVLVKCDVLINEPWD